MSESGRKNHNGYCTICGHQVVYNQKHSFVDGKCSVCDYECQHSVSEWTTVDDATHSGTCNICQAVVSKEHDFTNGACVCGKEEEIPVA